MKRVLAFLVLISLIFGTVLINSCKKEAVIPTLTTSAVTNITVSSGTSGGVISKDGGAAVTARGVCWSTTASPTISGSHTSDDKGTGSFTSSLTGLNPNTLYHVRAYATNSAGTAYGTEVTFTTTAIVVATLTTTIVSSITLTTAVSGGNITSDGNGAITARGVCWATTATPTITNSITTDGTGTGSFTSNLSGLLPAATYYVRAYATNSAGTAYGNEVSFTTSSIAVPTLTTAVATSITLTTAVSGGTISSNGGAVITVSGICWGTALNPTITDSHSTDGTTTGSFTSNLTGLSAGTTYHIRAYATNSVGTAYGNDVSFTTSAIVVPTLTTTIATSITLTTAVSGGTITSNGGALITVSGICWGTALNPTIADSHSTDGTATGSFTSNLTGLSAGTIYHVRAYATNSAGSAYGNDVSFTTTAAAVPTLTTTAATSINVTTAVSGGTITSNGGALITVSGICWGTALNPSVADSHSTDGTATGSFTSNLTGLSGGTTYHVRAYATNSAGTGYGNDLSFTTTASAVPTLTTTAVTSIDVTTAVSGGNISSDGGGAIIASGACWATTINPVATDSHTTDGTTIGIFTSNLTLLTAGTTYYVRAYATNSAGTAYGNQLSFNTKMADLDGNTYNTVTIGTQVWMAENLKTTLYKDGITSIPNVPLSADWIALSTPGFCWFNNDAATYKPLYGALYNWFTVNTGNLCPTGWHVPTDAEFSTLEGYLGMTSTEIAKSWLWRGTDQGTQMKNTTGWTAGQNGTNTSGFSALPGGYRYYVDGTFDNVGELSYWWSSTAVDATTSWYRRLDGTQTGVFRAGVDMKAGKYIRCLKD